MFEVLLAWFNLPFWTMILVVFIVLGTSILLGQLGSEADANSDLDIDTDLDTDLAIETDIEIETNIDVDLETSAEIEIDSNLGTDVILVSDPKDIRPQKKHNAFVLVLSNLLGFLNKGKVPLSILISSLLISWACLGLIINTTIYSIFKIYPGGIVLFAGILGTGFILSIPIVQKSSEVLGKIFETKSYHSSTKDYIGSVAIVTSHEIPLLDDVKKGTNIGILKYTDRFGNEQKLYAFRPDDSKIIPRYKDKVIIIDYIPERRIYKVLVEDSDDFFQWQK